MIDTDIQQEHEELVANLIKNPKDLLDELTPHKVELLHAAIGIASEAGEIVNAVKKYSIHGQEINMENVIEELGDLEFFMQNLRASLGISRNITLNSNITKLKKRYTSGSYSDKAAKDRADKL